MEGATCMLDCENSQTFDNTFTEETFTDETFTDDVCQIHEVVMTEQEVRDWHAYDAASTLIDTFQHQLVEILAAGPCTPKDVHRVLDLIKKTIHRHMDEWSVWNGVYWFVRRHGHGCAGQKNILRACKHKYDHTVLKVNATWTLAFLKETRDAAKKPEHEVLRLKKSNKTKKDE